MESEELTLAQQSRIGAFLGVALGDILGAALEGFAPAEIQQHLGTVVEVIDPMDVHRQRPERARLKGLHTDDTQQSWMVAAVLLEHGQVLPDALARYFREMGRPRAGLPDGVHRGIGPGFRAVVRHLIDKKSLRGAAQVSAGNGAAMRIVPIGVSYPGDLGRAALEGLHASGITHSDPRALEAAGALAGAVAALCCEDPPRDAETILEAAIEGAAKTEERLKKRHPVRPEMNREKFIGGVRRTLVELIRHIRTDHDELVRQVARLATTLEPHRPIEVPSVGFAPASVLAALAIAARADSFDEGLLKAVNLGFDADTVGAMTGGVLGARFPGQPQASPFMGDLIGRDPLTAVARSLAGVAGSSPPDPEAFEEDWTRMEREAIFERLGV